MNISLPTVIFPAWTRTKSGDNYYDLTSVGEWASAGTKLSMAQDHPILTPAILFVAKLFSQAEFYLERKSNGKRVDKHSFLSLLDQPNPFQTLPDFLETLMFLMISQGVGVVYKKTTIGFENSPNSLYPLNYDLIKWPDDIKKGMGSFMNRTSWEKYKKREVVYDEHGENITIKIGDLMFFYDLPNLLNKHPFKVSSRIDGLKQTLLNTHDSMTAKNIVLKSNGKELISGGKDGFPLGDDEKKNIETLYATQYGVTKTRKRGIITKANLNWKSLHIALRDLGLDESTKVDGNIIYTALHIPKDILSLEAKKTTYNNFKESMVSYVQNEMQSSLNSVIAVMKSLVDPIYRLKGDYNHLPIMQFILIEKYQGVKGRAEALNALRKSGIPDDLALELTDFETGIDLGPVMQLENNGQQNENQNESNQENETED